MAKSDKPTKIEAKAKTVGTKPDTPKTKAPDTSLPKDAAAGGQGRLTDPAILVPKDVDTPKAEVSPSDAGGPADIPTGGTRKDTPPVVPDVPPVSETAPPRDDAKSGDAKSGDTPSPVPGSSPVLAPVPVESPRVSTGPGFLTLLLGGLLAGAIGYAFATYGVLRPGSDLRAQQLEEVTARLDDQSSRLDTLSETATGAAAQAEAAADPEDVTALRDEIAAIESGLSNVQAEMANLTAAPAPNPDVETTGESPDLTPLFDLPERVAALSDRLDETSARIDEIGTGLDAKAPLSDLDAYESQLAALQGDLDGQRAAIEDARLAAADARTAAADETGRITVQAALAKISAALENGNPFADAVADLDSAGGIDAPAALGDTAGDGVATLGALQEEFPAAARRALSASIRETSGDGGTMDRLGAFLRDQTGARSLGAREGDDPDAILSRAQSAVRTGDLDTALGEIASLPEGGQAEMADWVARAQARVDATAALADLTAAQNSN